MKNWMMVLVVLLLVVQLSFLAGMRATGSGAARVDDGSVAVCDIYEVVDKLLLSERFQPALEAQRDELEEGLAPLREQIQAIEGELRGMEDQESEEFQTKFGEYQRLRQEFQQKAQRAERELQAATTQAFIDAYEIAKESANGISEELGYSYVLVSRTQQKEITSSTRDGVLNSILARGVIRSPEDADITADVIEDLKLE